MSWEDLRISGIDTDPFFSRFEVLFTHFNSGTGYSEPAGLRLLKATCGQQSHAKLFQDSPPECKLLENLKRAGYTTHTVFNHTGSLSTKMALDITKLAGAEPPMELTSFKPESVSYDGTPIYNNFEVLNAWWKKRMESGEARSALYYDTVSLHTGAHLTNQTDWWKESHLDHYRNSAKKTFSELSRFFDLIQVSGRKALVIVVSEHGAALAGSPIQRPEFREIPLPAIATVPLGAFFIGGLRPLDHLKITTPTSYPVIPLLINQGIANRAFDPAPLKSTPALPFLAENENAATLIQNHQLYYRGNDGKWGPLPSELIPEGMSE
jgi:cellulose synthase operon protein YhjU